jgi:RNA polymerase sigma factor (sigma-70 family)
MDGGGIDVDALYQKYGPMVLRRCRRILGDDDEALDVMQEVFVRVWTHRETLDVSYPSSLLFRIATNLSLNRLRDRKRRPSLPATRSSSTSRAATTWMRRSCWTACSAAIPSPRARWPSCTTWTA